MRTKTLPLIFALFFILIFFQKNYAQQEIELQEIHIPQNHRSGFHLFFTPEINYRALQSSTENQWIIDPKNDIETPAFSYSFGLLKVKQIAPLFDIEFGIMYSIRNIRTKKIDYLWDGMQLQPPSKIRYSYSYQYLQVPLKLSFYLNRKQKHYLGIGINLIDRFTDGGSHFAKTWDANGQFQGKEKISTPFYIGKSSGGIFIFGGWRKTLKDNLNWRIEPIIKFSLESATDKKYFKTFFYSCGVNLAIDFSFNSRN